MKPKPDDNLTQHDEFAREVARLLLLIFLGLLAASSLLVWLVD